MHAHIGGSAFRFCLLAFCYLLLAAKKAFRIPLEEADKRAVDLVAERPHSFTTTPKQFADYLGNFHTSVPEITVAASAHKLSLQSFLSGQVNQGEFCGLQIATCSRLT